jgi:hypothetical protein
MSQVIIRRNAGSTFIVELAGHNKAIGKTECIVSLPQKRGQRIFDSAQRSDVLKKAKELAEAFNAVLFDAFKL